jgi:hypothetical protein
MGGDRIVSDGRSVANRIPERAERPCALNASRTWVLQLKRAALRRFAPKPRRLAVARLLGRSVTTHGRGSPHGGPNEGGAGGPRFSLPKLAARPVSSQPSIQKCKTVLSSMVASPVGASTAASRASNSRRHTPGMNRNTGAMV